MKTHYLLLLLFLQEGKTIKSSSGFSGKGFKFDETEHALANERKKLQKAALGLQDSDDEDGALDVGLNFKVARFKTLPGFIQTYIKHPSYFKDLLYIS